VGHVQGFAAHKKDVKRKKSSSDRPILRHDKGIEETIVSETKIQDARRLGQKTE
jgi:hypothetical protein